MQYSTDVIAWLIEVYKRMSLKSPKFFQVLQAIGMIAALVTGIPLAIQQVSMMTGVEIHLPDVVNGVFIRCLFWCAVITKLISKLPVTDPSAPILPSGKTASRATSMPYTVKKEEEVTNKDYK